MRLFTMNIEQ